MNRRTKQALSCEPLLPRFDAGHVSAKHARLARTQNLREIFGPEQLATLFGENGELHWLSGEITSDRAPELRRYLMQELNVAEITPETIIPHLDAALLRVQPDIWIQGLYHFLNAQPALKRRLQDVPLIRLTDGSHVQSFANGQPLAFLPGKVSTGFPTVRASVCATETAREFLRSLGLTEPDPVDDVVRNVLPKYPDCRTTIADHEYSADITRIITAFSTDSKGQREKLIVALRDSPFVLTVDAGDATKGISKPSQAYLATERLKELFSGVTGIPLVDDSNTCLRGEDVRELLETCGATRYLQPIPAASTFTWQELLTMRVAAGCESMTCSEPIGDQTLRGLDKLLALLPTLVSESRRKKTASLWEALGELEDRRGTGIFSGTYRWQYYQWRSASFDAAFVRLLNAAKWLPDAAGNLQLPELVLFETLGWKPNPFLQSKIRFKPPIIEALAKEAGIEPGVLALLKQFAITNVADLRKKLGLPETETVQPQSQGGQGNVQSALESVFGGRVPAPPPAPDPASSTFNGTNKRNTSHGGSEIGDGSAAGAGRSTPTGYSAGGAGASPSRGSLGGGHGNRAEVTSGSHTIRSGGVGRQFISYIAAHPEAEPDPDGLDNQQRIALVAVTK